MASVKVTRVKKGGGPATANRVIIDRAGDRYSWTGTVEVAGSAVLGSSPAEFKTVYEAEVDALAWAMGHGATELTIEVDVG
jgi:hypothetical protein